MSQFCDEDDDWRLQKQKSAAPLLMQPPAAEDDRSSLGMIKKKDHGAQKTHGLLYFYHRYVLQVRTNDCSAQLTLRDPNLSNHPVKERNKYLPVRQK